MSEGSIWTGELWPAETMAVPTNQSVAVRGAAAAAHRSITAAAAAEVISRPRRRPERFVWNDAVIWLEYLDWLVNGSPLQGNIGA